jgi:acylphosphatase
MPYARKIILHTPLANPAKLDSFVEDCLADGVVLIAVLGPDSEKVEDLIDELVVGDASDKSRFADLLLARLTMSARVRCSTGGKVGRSKLGTTKSSAISPGQDNPSLS